MQNTGFFIINMPKGIYPRKLFYSGETKDNLPYLFWCREYYKKNKTKILKYSKEYYEKNKVNISKKFKDYHKEYCERNSIRRNLWLKEWRHKQGISKKYNNGEHSGISYTKEYKRLQAQKRKALFKGGGELTIKTIQQVYEDNIKQYGTLTCYLCLKPILLNEDTLEHKVPLTRGGNNEKNNLAIAHHRCNCKKHTKTVEEFLAKGGKKSI